MSIPVDMWANMSIIKIKKRAGTQTTGGRYESF
jgi:hypothetical protein